MPGHVRTHVYFSEQAYRTLEDLSARTGLSMSEVVREALKLYAIAVETGGSEVVREAIKLYAWSTELRAQGGKILSERDGKLRELISL